MSASQQQWNAGRFLLHLRSESAPFVLRRRDRAPRWSDRSFHEQIYHDSPEFYATCALADGVQPTQQVRVLFQLLRASRKGLDRQTRQILERITRRLLSLLSVDRVLQAFLALRRVRANHKHTTRAMVCYLLEHPFLEELVHRRRPALVDCLEHALGKEVLRGCLRRIREGEGESRYVRQHLWRWLRRQEHEPLQRVLLALYQQEKLPASGRRGYELFHKAFESEQSRQAKPSFPKTVTATNRGEIAAALYHLYRGGRTTQLIEAIHHYADQRAAKMPRFEGTVALVLDASASTRGYGEREYCIIAQSVALQLVLERCCSHLLVHTVGGEGDPPVPYGTTDLAGALLDAVEEEPDLVVVVTDGYENHLDGDLGLVLRSLRAAGHEIPVALCASKFTHKDDMTLRRPTAEAVDFSFWHEDEFADLLISLFSLARGKMGQNFLQQQLVQRLEEMEEEVPSWIDN